MKILLLLIPLLTISCASNNKVNKFRTPSTAASGHSDSSQLPPQHSIGSGNITILVEDSQSADTEKIKAMYFNVIDKNGGKRMLDLISESSKVCQLSIGTLRENELKPVPLMSFLKDPKSGITCYVKEGRTTANKIELDWSL